MTRQYLSVKVSDVIPTGKHEHVKRFHSWIFGMLVASLISWNSHLPFETEFFEVPSISSKLWHYEKELWLKTFIVGSEGLSIHNHIQHDFDRTEICFNGIWNTSMGSRFHVKALISLPHISIIWKQTDTYFFSNMLARLAADR